METRPRSPIITLTTDFGPASHYVGLMKGVILQIAPKATVVDFTHDLAAHDTVAAAVILESLLGCFPDGTIHVAVVDPGVGTQRDPIAIQTKRYVWIGPDNGVFTAVSGQDAPMRAVRLSDPRLHRHPVSHTFHGRDIFAPVAAHLANGASIDLLGDPVERPIKLELPEPIVRGGQLVAHVVYADHFGNLVTDLTVDRFERWSGGEGQQSGCGVNVRVGAQLIKEISLTFGDVPRGCWVAYFGSGDRLEIAINQGRAVDQLIEFHQRGIEVCLQPGRHDA